MSAALPEAGLDGQRGVRQGAAQIAPVHHIVLASGNRGKLCEFSALVSSLSTALNIPFNIQLTAQSELGITAVQETGGSYIDNALIKARHAAAHTQRAVLADDSGLEVQALGGAPGIYSARYAGATATDQQNREVLLRRLAESGDENFAACFRCALAYIDPMKDAEPVIVEASWHGEISVTPRGDGGFGYDSIFYLPDRCCTAAELPADEKNRISHRAQALRQLLLRQSQWCLTWVSP